MDKGIKSKETGPNGQRYEGQRNRTNGQRYEGQRNRTNGRTKV